MEIDILEPIALKSNAIKAGKFFPNTIEFEHIIHNSRSNIFNELIESSTIEESSTIFSSDIKHQFKEYEYIIILVYQ